MGTLCKRSRVTSAERVTGQEDYTRTLHPTNPPGKAPSFLGPNEHVCLVILKSNVRILCNYLAWEIRSIESTHKSGRTSRMCAQLWACISTQGSLPIVPCSDSDCFSVCFYPQAFCYVLLSSSQHFEPSVNSNWISGGTWTLDQSC